MKKTIIIAIIAICTVLCFTTCKSIVSVLDEPIVSLHSVELAGINFNGAQLLCKVQIENPNGFDIPFPEVGWELFLNTNSLVNGKIKNNQRLKAKEKTIVEVPVGFEYLEAFNAITSLIGRGSVNYKVALALKFNLPLLGEKVWNFAHDGSIPLPQIPKFNAPALKVEKFNLSGTDVVFSMNIQNPNSFELPPPKIKFDFQVNKTSIVNTTSTTDKLKPNSATSVQTRLTVNQADLIRTLGASLLTGSSIGCNMNVSVDFGVPAFGKEPTTLQVPGTLPLR